MIKPAATKVVKPKVTTKQPAVAIKDIGTSYAANSPEVAALSRTKTATATKVLPSKTEPTAAIPTGSQETTYGANVKAVNDLSATARSVTTPNYTQAIKDGLAMPSTPVAQKTAVAAFQPTSAKFQQVAINDEGVISGTPNIERFPTIGNPTDKLHTYTGVTGGVGPLSGKIIQDFTTSKPTVANAEALASTRGGKIVRPPRITKTDKTKTADGSEGEVADGTESPTDGGGENGGENIEGTPTNYAEFIAQQNASAKADYDTLLAEIEKQKQDALHQAEVDKERSMVDAQSSYAQNKATYGANAEALASMGLSGSGYSDYINSSAYAQKVGADQAASSREILSKQQAESTASQQKLTAQTDYNSFLRSQGEKLFQYQQNEAEKNNSKYATLMQNAISGNYSQVEIASLAEQFGLTPEQTQQLQSAAERVTSEKKIAENNSTYLSLVEVAGNLDISVDTIMAIAQRQGLSQEEVDGILSMRSGYLQSNYIAGIKDGSIDTSEVDDKAKTGELSPEHYNSIKAAFETEFLAAFEQSNGFMRCGSYEEAKQQYEACIAHPWLSDEAKSKIEQAYQSAIQSKWAQDFGSDDEKDATTADALTKSAEKATYQKQEGSKYGYDYPDNTYSCDVGTGWNAGKVYVTINPKVGGGGDSYELKRGSAVEDSGTIGALNELVTGDKTKAPNDLNNHTMVVYQGTLYIYAYKPFNGYRWESVKSGKHDVNNVIKAYMGL